jgi:subtilase family serine protease
MMSPKHILSITIFALASAAATDSFADPADLMRGAQAIPARNAGAIVIPSSSLVQPQDKGTRMHTNVRFFVPANARSPAGTTGGPPVSGLNFETPASLACIYGLTASGGACNPNVATAVAAGGSRAIAIVDAFDYSGALADLKVFSAQFGLPAPTSGNFQVVFASGREPRGNAGWELEMALDIDMAHAMAPNAKIYLVEAASDSFSDLLLAVDKAAQLVASAGGGEVSMSWGGSEFAGETTYDSHFVKSGVTFFAATGDSPGVQWPSASANVVAVGGASLARQLGTFSFLHHASWSDAGAGLSAYVGRPAYQASLASTIGSSRAVPDIAAVADPNTGVWVYDSGNGGWLTVGGTSVAAPLVAAVVNASGHFYSSSALELQTLYQNSAANPASYAAATTGYCGPQAAFSVSAGWNPCLGVGSPKGLSAQ